MGRNRIINYAAFDLRFSLCSSAAMQRPAYNTAGHHPLVLYCSRGANEQQRVAAVTIVAARVAAISTVLKTIMTVPVSRVTRVLSLFTLAAECSAFVLQSVQSMHSIERQHPIQPQAMDLRRFVCAPSSSRIRATPTPTPRRFSSRRVRALKGLLFMASNSEERYGGRDFDSHAEVRQLLLLLICFALLYKKQWTAAPLTAVVSSHHTRIPPYILSTKYHRVRSVPYHGITAVQQH